MIPQDNHPEVNFIGLLIGPRWALFVLLFVIVVVFVVGIFSHAQSPLLPTPPTTTHTHTQIVLGKSNWEIES